MKILIAGAGAVGTHLAKLLEQEDHDITLMDANKERLSIIRDNSDVLTYIGNCTSLKDLTQETRPRSFQINTLSDDLDDISLLLDKGCY